MVSLHHAEGDDDDDDDTKGFILKISCQQSYVKNNMQNNGKILKDRFSARQKRKYEYFALHLKRKWTTLVHE